MSSYCSLATTLLASAAASSLPVSVSLPVIPASPPSFAPDLASSLATARRLRSMSLASVCTVSSALARSALAACTAGMIPRCSWSGCSTCTAWPVAERCSRLWRTSDPPSALRAGAMASCSLASSNLANLMSSRPSAALASLMSCSDCTTPSAAPLESLRSFSSSPKASLCARYSVSSSWSPALEPRSFIMPCLHSLSERSGLRLAFAATAASAGVLAAADPITCEPSVLAASLALAMAERTLAVDGRSPSVSKKRTRCGLDASTGCCASRLSHCSSRWRRNSTNSWSELEASASFSGRGGTKKPRCASHSASWSLTKSRKRRRTTMLPPLCAVRYAGSVADVVTLYVT
mmetsp:Transcript_14114/g.58949  ORF Transcript_14114/g.58949 Transcript_14114/m.58949 type:complete len:349 (-) Transcript_14114:164-1210(-)